MYNNLTCGRAHESIPDNKLCDILDLIWHHDNGQEVVIEILSTRFHGLNQNQTYIPSDFLKEKSASWLALFDYSKERNYFNGKDYNFTQIANVCFSNNANEEHALAVFSNIKDRILKHIIGHIDLHDFLATMVQMHPILALNVFIGDELKVPPQMKNATKGLFNKKTSPFSAVDIKSTIEWCNKKPEVRYSKLADIITPYQTIGSTIQWTSLALELLKNSINPINVLEKYSSNLHFSFWSGSKAKKLESRLPLFGILKLHANNEISSWAINEEIRWKKFIAKEYEREIEDDINTNEQFEW